MRTSSNICWIGSCGAPRTSASGVPRQLIAWEHPGRGIMRNLLVVTACAGLLLEGCSSRPREFTPTLGIATADPAGFDHAYATCTQLMAAGKLNQDGRSGSRGAGAAAGATAAAVGAGTAVAIGRLAPLSAYWMRSRQPAFGQFRTAAAPERTSAFGKQHSGRKRRLVCQNRRQDCQPTALKCVDQARDSEIVQ
jgi:hypothetical protein